MADPKVIAATQVIRLPMRAAEIASVRVLDTDLIVILKSGQRVTIRDGAMRAMIDTNLRIAFADGEIRAADLLKQVGSVQADALSDLSVASKDAATADASKTPDTNAPGKPLDVLSSNTELNKNITDLLTKQQTQIELLSRQLETFSSSIDTKLAKITPPEDASLAPAAAKSGFLANISPAWGALGALGAAGGAGGGGAAAAAVVSAASSGPVNLVSLSITGTVTLGPILATNQLRVVAYDRDGKVLGSDEAVEGTTGAFEIKITNGYSGVVIFKVLDGNPNAADYMDEATKTGLSLGKTGALPDLRAIVVTEGIIPKIVNINPLTELAAVKSGLAEGSVVTSKSSAELLTISKALAKTLELSTTDQLLSDIAVIPTINLDGSTNASANDAGKLLDTISQLEKLNNFTSPTAAIATVAGQLKDVVNGESGFKDPTVTNVAQFQTAVLQTPPTIAGVTFSADTGVSGTDLITSNGTQNITVKFSKALGNTRTLSWKTTDSGVWSAPVAGNGTDTLVLTGASLSSGSKTLQFRYTSTATSLSEAAQVNTGVNLDYTLDTTAPTTPVVTGLGFSVDSGTSGTDLITNSAGQTVSGTITSAVFATERIFGSVDGGGTWSEITNRSTSSVTGATTFNWNVAALVNQTAPGASGTKSLVFQVRDAAGNVSVNSSEKTYVLDTTVPAAPGLAPGTGVFNGASLAEATNTGAVTVTGDVGASITVTFKRGSNEVTKTVIGNGSTPVPVTLTNNELNTLGNGVINITDTINVTASQTDLAGNAQTADPATISFTLDTIAPGAPVLALGTGVADGATSAEAIAAGGVVTVTGETGASITVTFKRGSNEVIKTVIGNSSTPVAVTLIGTDLTTLGDGAINVSASQIDAAGNAQTVAPATASFTLDTAAPSFTSSLTDNFVEGVAITAYDAHTTEGDTGMTYTLRSGDDAALFSINSSSGVVTFINPPEHASAL
ncbi:MAG: beta strand repeat-containing protein, partial [Betaproteobacteria bacterium]